MKNLAFASVIGVTSILITAPAFAANDNIFYSFEIKPYHGNGYTEERYRQTTNVNNKWKVDLQASGEGKGTITTFWLDKNLTVVSNLYDVKQGSGAQYYSAYHTASQVYVGLGAENNNYSANSYTVSGVWDEETN
ncbi:DUF2712 domain-containing protein [Sutcliffiella horikoshii]|uniref:DUF2712 domain-containing protein n=2 Tax=Sutcliffiella horikoshii TaxID=79883 RepID=A0A5D4SX25_9BACI|nr:DUF2712 domain-containing protein [Sutcliffiella horikoshii]TYS67940.1 DUF2712 domain-containing protein [Sutcliffiella horikoshii]